MRVIYRISSSSSALITIFILIAWTSAYSSSTRHLRLIIRIAIRSMLIYSLVFLFVFFTSSSASFTTVFHIHLLYLCPLFSSGVLLFTHPPLAIIISLAEFSILFSFVNFFYFPHSLLPLINSVISFVVCSRKVSPHLTLTSL